MFKLFSLLKKEKDAFDKNGNLLLFLVYPDRVVSFFLQKKTDKTKQDKIIIRDFFGEPIEMSFLGLDFKKIALNCFKSKIYLEKKNKINFNNSVFVISPEFAKTSFYSKSFDRKDKNKKISQDEFNRMVFEIKKEVSKTDDYVFDVDIQRVFIDGYLVQNCVESLGGNIKIDTTFTLSHLNYKKELQKISDVLRLKLKKIFKLSDVLIDYKIKSDKQNDFVFLNIAGNTSSLFLIKEKKVAGIINLPFGFDGFLKNVKKEFFIDEKETRSIISEFIFGELNDEVSEKIGKIAFDYSSKFLNDIKPAFKVLDRDNILPSSFFVSFCYNNIPSAFFQIFKKSNNWFSDLPFMDNIDITLIDEGVFNEDKKMHIYAIIYALSNN